MTFDMYCFKRFIKKNDPIIVKINSNYSLYSRISVSAIFNTVHPNYKNYLHSLFNLVLLNKFILKNKTFNNFLTITKRI
jgi:hypothetical protein